MKHRQDAPQLEKIRTTLLTARRHYSEKFRASNTQERQSPLSDENDRRPVRRIAPHNFSFASNCVASRSETGNQPPCRKPKKENFPAPTEAPPQKAGQP